MLHVGDIAANEAVGNTSSDVILSYKARNLDAEENSYQLDTIAHDPTALILVLLSFHLQVLAQLRLLYLLYQQPLFSIPQLLPEMKKYQKTTVKISDVQKAQTEVLELEKEKLKVENAKLIKEKLKMELYQIFDMFIEYLFKLLDIQANVRCT